MPKSWVRWLSPATPVSAVPSGQVVAAQPRQAARTELASAASATPEFAVGAFERKRYPEKYPRITKGPSSASATKHPPRSRRFSRIRSLTVRSGIYLSLHRPAEMAASEGSRIYRLPRVENVPRRRRETRTYISSHLSALLAGNVNRAPTCLASGVGRACSNGKDGAPGETRTPGLLIRSQIDRLPSVSLPLTNCIDEAYLLLLCDTRSYRAIFR